MIFYPKIYVNKVTDITPDLLLKNNIQGLALDVDNTLIDFNLNIIEGLEKWANNMKKNNIKLCILSNSNKVSKVKMLSELLEIPYFYFAKKPLKFGFNKVKKMMNINNENIGVVGDQIFTDILGANRCKMFSILVNPIAKKDIWITVFKRPIENIIIKSYKNKIKEKTKDVYK